MADDGVRWLLLSKGTVGMLLAACPPRRKRLRMSVLRRFALPVRTAFFVWGRVDKWGQESRASISCIIIATGTVQDFAHADTSRDRHSLFAHMEQYINAVTFLQNGVEERAAILARDCPAFSRAHTNAQMPADKAQQAGWL